MTDRQDCTKRTVPNAGRRVFSLLLLLALLFALLLRLPQPSLAASEPDAGILGAVPVVPDAHTGDASVLPGAGTLSVSPSSSTIDVGGTVTVDVWISDTADLYGMDFCISFDSTIVSVPSNDATLVWEVLDPVYKWVLFNSVSSAEETSCPCSHIPTDSLYHYLVTNLDPAEPFAGSGRFARLTFQGLAPGTTALHFCCAFGSNKTGFLLYPAQVDGSITVTGPTATPTPTPTATPRIPGDLDGDCDVDIVDIMFVASRWGARTGDTSYDARYDLDSDGDIDVVDIMTVATHWGQRCSDSPPEPATVS